MPLCPGVVVPLYYLAWWGDLVLHACFTEIQCVVMHLCMHAVNGHTRLANLASSSTSILFSFSAR